jgi:Phage integrase family
LGADSDDLDFDRGHRTLRVIHKGGKHAIVPLAPRTSRALGLYFGERTSGPLFLGALGGRMDRCAADRTVKRLARQAGIAKRISPHSLRHSFITAALDAGVALRDVQEAANHADPRTTMRYDRARRSLDRHATYVVAAFVAGALADRASSLTTATRSRRVSSGQWPRWRRDYRAGVDCGTAVPRCAGRQQSWIRLCGHAFCMASALTNQRRSHSCTRAMLEVRDRSVTICSNAPASGGALGGLSLLKRCHAETNVCTEYVFIGSSIPAARAIGPTRLLKLSAASWDSHTSTIQKPSFPLSGDMDQHALDPSGGGRLPRLLGIHEGPERDWSATPCSKEVMLLVRRRTADLERLGERVPTTNPASPRATTASRCAR